MEPALSAVERGGETPLSKVLRASFSGTNFLSLTATSNSLSGDYILHDAEWAAVVIDTTLRIDRRTLLPSLDRCSRPGRREVHRDRTE